MKEAYVSYETSKLLKEKGFDWEVFHFYNERGEFRYREGDCYSLYNWNYPTKDEYGSQYCSAPTQQMACRWLREENGIHISADIYKDSSNDADGNVVDEWTYWAWIFYWLPSGNIGDEEGYDQFDSYEDAIEAALEFVLTKLI